eukprot:TRINITY_DN62839_c0_g1_i1.p1 TRINITY_DN62839_c0_g1~~TRINITY_DN62839_c0_g1_i1.p1  ORF type:complete len:358 (+),score=44.40 TRINITY_DN62839_c0_g1_i1:50-1123(+)
MISAVLRPPVVACLVKMYRPCYADLVLLVLAGSSYSLWLAEGIRVDDQANSEARQAYLNTRFEQLQLHKSILEAKLLALEHADEVIDHVTRDSSGHVTKEVDWRKCWNGAGWCKARGPLVGLWHGNCDNLNCVEKAVYADVPTARCFKKPWDTSVNGGWSKCPEGSFMTAIYVIACSGLDCIKNVMCCFQPQQEDYAGECRGVSWKASMRRKNTMSTCPSGMAIVGLRRASCTAFSCIERAMCCPFRYTTPPLLNVQPFRIGASSLDIPLEPSSSTVGPAQRQSPTTSLSTPARESPLINSEQTSLLSADLPGHELLQFQKSSASQYSRASDDDCMSQLKSIQEVVNAVTRSCAEIG